MCVGCPITGSISMISGKRFSFRLGLVLLASLPSLSAQASGLVLKQILNPAEQPRVIRYREEKSLGILEQTLSGSGVLHFTPPDTLVREMDGTRNITYRIEGSQISVSKDGKLQRQLDLQTYPELAGVAVTLRALLKGDIETLKQQYALTLSGTLANWTLQLTPRNAPLSRLIDGLSIEGSQGQIRIIDTYEKGGNHSRMTLLVDE